ncbi:MAG TPA: DUF2752 domain-containing protein [Planctomycetes bacterium]|nr:DUF2752 domain-containing protein [Planctomycetota bacterium]
MPPWELIFWLLLDAAILYLLIRVGLTHPDARGIGTHEQLGRPPCSWPILYNMPCPTCGVTTATAHLLHLHPIRAFLTQPFGMALALSAVGMVLGSIWFGVRGESLLFRLSRWNWGLVLLGGVVLLLVSWWWKVATWGG